MSTDELESVFSFLGIPGEVKGVYASLGLQALFPWQQECLFSTHVMEGGNLVYCAPTSGGKTFIAELVMLKTAFRMKKKAMLVLPYVSLVVEKERHFAKLLRAFNASAPPSEKRRVKAYHGNVSTSKPFQEDIIICTIEKANAVLNTLVSRNQLSRLGCLALDETHILGSSFNGFMLELLISKILYSNIRNSASPVQIIALSATVGNVEQFAQWMRAQFYRTNFRPVPLYEHVKAGDLVLDKEGRTLRSLPGTEADREAIGKLCSEGMQCGQQVIVFCPTKQACVDTCMLLAKLLGNCSHVTDPRTLPGREKMLSIFKDRQLPYDARAMQALTHGIAYHNSSLDGFTRESIEKAFSQGLVSILCATSTLAAGVNLPAGRVIIRSMQLGRDALDVVHYRQMAGRAGRAGQTSFGECFLVVRQGERDRALALANQSLPGISSQLDPHNDGGCAVLKGIVETAVLGLCSSAKDMEQFLGCTLWAVQATAQQISQTADSFLRYLMQARILEATGEDPASNTRISVTRFGEAMVSANFNPDEAIVIYKSLLCALDGLSLEQPLHLLYLCTPMEIPLVPNYRKLLSLHDHHRSFRSLFQLIGANAAHLNKWCVQPPPLNAVHRCAELQRAASLAHLFPERSKGGVKAGHSAPHGLSPSEWNTLCVVKRLWAAMALQALADGVPAAAVSQQFDSDAGILVTLQQQARMTASKVIRFTKCMGWTLLHRILKDYKHVLDVDAPREMKSLLAIPRMTRKVAKVLLAYQCDTVDKFLLQEVHTIVQWLQLSIGFELQDIRSVQLAFSENPSSEDDGSIVSLAGSKEDAVAAQSRDDEVYEQLTQLITALLASARTLRPGPSSGDSSLCLDGEGMVNAADGASGQPFGGHFGNEEKEEDEDDDDRSTSSSSSTLSSSSSSSSSQESPSSDMEDEVDEAAAISPIIRKAPSHERPQWEDPAPPLKLPRPGEPPVATPVSSVKRVVVTPAAANRANGDGALWEGAVERYVDDEDLLFMMLELEAHGVVLPVSTASPEAQVFQYVSHLAPDAGTAARVEIRSTENGPFPLSLTLPRALPQSPAPVFRPKVEYPMAVPSLSQNSPLELGVNTGCALGEDQLDDAALCQMMDDWERSQIPAAKPSPCTRRGSARGTNGGHQPAPTTPAVVKSRSASPYCTPFTASKFTASGRYLYHPFASPDQLSSSALPASLSYVHTAAEINIRSLESVADVVWLHELLDRHACISFDLLYRPFPASLLEFYTAPTSHRDALQSWTALLSSRAEASIPHRMLDSNGAPLDLPSNPSQQLVREKTPMVLAGALLCLAHSSGVQCFHLRLPCPLPLLRFSTSAKSIAPTATSALEMLPLACKMRVIAYVGFGPLLCKSAGLYDCRASLEPNPLMLVSRNWCLATRHALLKAWPEVMEWRWLQQLMASTSIRKVSAHMSLQLARLRERDLIVKGPLGDPLQVTSLLNEAGLSLWDAHSTTRWTSLFMSDGEAGLGWAGVDPERWRLQLSGFRAARSLTCVSQADNLLSSHPSLREYCMNIELPVLHCTAALQQHGLLVNAMPIHQLLRDLKDRNQVVVQLLRGCISPAFQPENEGDVRSLQQRVYKLVWSQAASHRSANSQCYASSESKQQQRGKDTEQQVHRNARVHPLQVLLNEYQSNAHLSSLLLSTLRERRFGRVCSAVSDIDSISIGGGLAGPSCRLQAIPPTVRIVSTERPTVWQEVQSSLQGNFKPALAALNESLRRAPEYCYLLSAPSDFFPSDFFPSRCVVVLLSILPPGHRKELAGDTVLLAEVQICGPVLAEGSKVEKWTVPLDALQRTGAAPRAQAIEVEWLMQSLSPPACQLPAQSPAVVTKAYDLHGAFVAAPGFRLVAAEYCQLELRLLAHFSEDCTLLRVFQDGVDGDPLTALARDWYGKQEVTAEERTAVKQWSYGMLYGPATQQFEDAEKENSSRESVQDRAAALLAFMERYSGVRDFLAAMSLIAQEEGFVDTLLGRRVALVEEENVADDGSPWSAESRAGRVLCQCSAADLLKLAMVNVDHSLRELSGSRQHDTAWQYQAPRSFPGAGLYRCADEIRLVLQLPDQVVYEVREEAVADVAAVLQRCMRSAVQLRVPLKVILREGQSWGTLQPLKVDEKRLVDGCAQGAIVRNLFGKD